MEVMCTTLQKILPALSSVIIYILCSLQTIQAL
jgi:hypothetical protein